MRLVSVVLSLVLLHAFLPETAVCVQSRSSKPALIRDTEAAEGKDDPGTKEKVYSPLEAEKSVKVGDFYFRRKNFQAAIQRYLEALEYQPNLIVAYESLGKAYEKNGNPGKALEVYRDYILKNPSSSKVPEFQSRINRLEKKS